MDKPSLIRTIVLIFALVNQGLAAYGWSPLPFEEADVENFVAFLITTIAALVAWWKNNYVGRKGKMQKEFLEPKGLK